MTATKTKPTTPATIVDDVHRSQEELQKACDDACERVAKGGEFTPGDYELFTVRGWSRAEITKAVENFKTIQRTQQQAGTKAARERAKKAAEEAADKLQTRGEEIRQEIATLEAEHQLLANAAAQAESRVVEMQRSVEKLRTMVPTRVRQMYDFRVANIKQKFCRINEIDAELNALTALEAIDLNTPEGKAGAKLHFQAIGRGSETVKAASERITVTQRNDVGRGEWANYLNARLSARPQLQAELEKLRAERDDALADAADLLNFHVQ